MARMASSTSVLEHSIIEYHYFIIQGQRPTFIAYILVIKRSLNYDNPYSASPLLVGAANNHLWRWITWWKVLAGYLRRQPFYHSSPTTLSFIFCSSSIPETCIHFLFRETQLRRGFFALFLELMLGLHGLITQAKRAKSR
jgi:hypothetical protein